MRQNSVSIIEHMCYHTIGICRERGEAMRLLRLAVENQRWDLAAHAIVFATARLLNNVLQGDSTGRGDKPHASRSTEEKRRPKGQSKR